ncbi:MAG: flippase-like domain-containing protein [Alphaproteobacteria bacterium]|nr:flippase-like domain-containing protein [Alphaproteobacteria bacterium]
MPRRSWIRRLAGVALALLVLAAVAWSVDGAVLRAALEGASWVGLGVAGLAYMPAWGMRGWRWQMLAEDLGDRVPLGPAVATATVGNMLNLLLPAKAGDLLWANAATARWGVPYGRAVVGVLAGRVLDLVVLTGMGAAALAVIPGGSERFGAAVAASAVAGGAAMLAGWWVFVRLRAGRAVLRGPLARLGGIHDALIEPTATLTARPARAVRHLGTTALIWLNEGLIAWLCARALGLALPFPAIVFAIMVANLSKILPLTPASFGTYEAAGALALGAAGLGYTEAFAVMLAEHVLKNTVNLALGILGMALTEVPVLDVDLPRLRAAWTQSVSVTPPRDAA